MKKILSFISIMMIILFVGCSAEPNYSNDSYTSTANTIGSHDYYEYSLNEFMFTNINNEDILKYILNDTEDFYIAMSENYSIYLEDIDKGTISKLYEIVNRNDEVNSLNSLLNKTAAELNVLAIEVNIALTVEDIVGFYDLKNNNPYIHGTVSLTLESYVSLRLARSLTLNEEEGLNLFVEVYYFLLEYTSSYDYTNKVFIDIIADLDNEGYIYTPEELDTIEVGFNLLIEIHNL